VRQLSLLVLAALISPAAADAPTGYQCAPGKSNVGVGCACPDGYAAARDGENTAICRAKPRPVQPKVEPKVEPKPVVPKPIEPVVVPLPTARPPVVKLATTVTDRYRAPTATKPVLKPSVDPDSLSSNVGVVSQVRADQIQLIEALIAETPDSEADEKADLYFRLAEAYGHQQRYWSLKALEGKDASAIGKAKDALIKAIAVYRKLTENTAFRNYAKMDSALFFYGYVVQRGKYAKEATAIYLRLVKEYPSSKFIPDVYVALGDQAFDVNDIENAAAYYERATKFPRSWAYTYALYKSGFVRHGQQRYQDAFEIWFKTSELAKNDKRLAALGTASKHALVAVYAEFGKPEMGLKVVERIDPAARTQLAEELATIYVARGSFDRASQVYRSLLVALPDDSAWCKWSLAFSRTLAVADGKPQQVQVCTADADAFKQWARTTGIDVK
jgi:tetratricopeptide (TPR) repeat protein